MVSMDERENHLTFGHTVEDEMSSDDDLDLETWLSIDVSLWIFRVVVVGLLIYIVRCVVNIENKLDAIPQPQRTNFSYRYKADETDNVYVGKLKSWGENIPVGRQMATLFIIPQYFCKLIFNVVFLPAKYILSKVSYLLYLITILCLFLLFSYWILYTFLANTLGAWAVAVLPKPSNLAKETIFHIGRISISVWDSFTDFIRERVYHIYGHINGAPVGTPQRGSIARRRTMRGSVPYPMKYARRDPNMPRVPQKLDIKNTRIKLDSPIKEDDYRRIKDDDDENKLNRPMKSKYKLGAANWDSGTNAIDRNKNLNKRDVPVEVLAPSRLGFKQGFKTWY